MKSPRSILVSTIVSLFIMNWCLAAEPEQTFVSHPPMRPLPVASSRPIADGPTLFVDANRGSDQGDGSKARPWQTLAHAVQQLNPGATLCLRGGTYYEHVTVSARGTEAKPITIRSHLGELAVIDGGLREFFETPAAAWEPYPDGAAGEFRSVKTYPNLGGSAGGTNVLGRFGDSMVPLHGYRHTSDLRTSNEYFYKLDANKTEAGDGVYCGPGVYYDAESERIHVRLGHTNQRALGDDNYLGETDPRKLPLVISGLNAGPALSVAGARYLRIQDIVVRGARTATVSVSNSVNIEFDGVTAYGGSTAFGVSDSAGLRLWNCACRGIAAPWTYRGSLKYRAIEAKIFAASGWTPTSTDKHDFELAYSEFTDCVDGVFIGNVKNLRFHHNLLDNVSDDGMFLTSTTAYDGTTPGGNIHIYENLLSRCLTTFAFGVGHGRQKMTPRGRQTGVGVFIYRNVFDFRRPVMYSQPKEEESQITSYGRVASDHGGPLWEPMTIYHNTIVQTEGPFRGYYLDGLGGHMGGGSMRRLFNNVVVHATGQPGHVLPPVVSPESTLAVASNDEPEKPVNPLDDLLDGEKKKKSKSGTNSLETPDLVKLKKDLAKESLPKAPLPIDFQADGNLHWSFAEPPTAERMFSRFRGSPDFETSKTLYRPGWTTRDVVADPKFAKFDADWRTAMDCRLDGTSPAIDMGVQVPSDWPDPLRKFDAGKPDIGAIPSGVKPWPIGIRGRLNVFGQLAAASLEASAPPADFPVPADQIPAERSHSGKPLVLMQGYPAFDAPLIEFALNRRSVRFESLERTWLDPAEYSNYSAVIVVGDLARAKIEPNKYTAADLKHVEQYLQRGGTLMLMRGNTTLFTGPEGRVFLPKLTGTNNAKRDTFEFLLPKHRWISHLNPKQPAEWINAPNVQPLRATNGELIIGSRAGMASLYRLPVGAGQLIYFGWDVASSLPHGRESSTVEQEATYEQQLQTLSNVIESVVSQEK